MVKYIRSARNLHPHFSWFSFQWGDQRIFIWLWVTFNHATIFYVSLLYLINEEITLIVIDLSLNFQADLVEQTLGPREKVVATFLFGLFF